MLDRAVNYLRNLEEEIFCSDSNHQGGEFNMAAKKKAAKKAAPKKKAAKKKK